MTEQPNAPHVTAQLPVDLSAAHVAETTDLLNRWLAVIENSSSTRKEAFRSQVNGVLDALKRVEQQRFNYDTHVGKIAVTEGERSYPILFHYQVPVVSPADRRPKDNATAKLAGIVKDPQLAGSAPVATMLAVHMYVAGRATNRSVELQADFPGLIKYYEQFGYKVDASRQNVDKPFMTADLDAMSTSQAATGN